MELRVLEYFLTVVREENISRAAEVLHVTQPTLSRQMKELEDELHTTLFIRGKHGIFTHPVLSEIGARYGKTAAQIALKWNTQRGVSILPKSVHVERMEQNIDIWDFTLSEEDIRKIAELDLGHSEIVDHGDPAFVKMINGFQV